MLLDVAQTPISPPPPKKEGGEWTNEPLTRKQKLPAQYGLNLKGCFQKVFVLTHLAAFKYDCQVIIQLIGVCMRNEII